MLVRPTVIAITFNARNRGTGLIQELVDWRLMVIFFRPAPAPGDPSVAHRHHALSAALVNHVVRH